MIIATIILSLCLSSIWAIPSRDQQKIVPLKNIGSRIINGEDAAKGQFPWQAAVYFDKFGATYFCGGTLINPEWILTAGHCVDGADIFTVHLGSNTLSSPDEDRVTVTSTTYIIHEGYDELVLANDIGLIKIPAVELNDNIQTISLSTSSLQNDVPITVSGYGKTSDASSSVSNQLEYVSLTTISNDACADYYGSIIVDNMVCARGNTIESTCNGDSGGPVVINADSNPEHVAIVSFVSSLGCESGYPSGYTRSFEYADWISENTGIKF